MCVRLLLCFACCGISLVGYGQDQAPAEEQPVQPESLLAKASALYLVGEIESALEAVQQALRAEPNNSQALRLQRALLTERSQLKDQESLKIQLAEANAEIGSLKSQLASAVSLGATLSGERDQAVSGREAADREVAQLKAQIGSLEAASEGDRSAIDRLTSSLAAASQQVQEAEGLKTQFADVSARLQEAEANRRGSEGLGDVAQVTPLLEGLRAALDLEKDVPLSTVLDQASQRILALKEQLAFALGDLAKREGETEAG